MSNWPLTLRLKVEGIGDVLFCHATPRNDFELFTKQTPVERVRPMLEDTAALVVCGHTHMQFDRMVGAVRVVNAGSVGMPFSRPAGAYWLLLDGSVEFRRTMYDTGAAAARLRSTGYPQVEDLVVRYVVDPPSEAETLELFAPAEVK
jgi:diadenosine tetraphosphatase ApaH/serine/threonine PP2A family protein phosphatase